MDYQIVKNWFAEKENKQKCVIGVCFALVFIVGFGAGSFDKELQKAKLKSQANYTTKSSLKQTPAPAAAGAGETAVADPAPVAAQVKGAATAANCPVKGNINSKGGKIYHIPGGAFYTLVKPEQCFNTEAEALAAGFVKSSR